MTSSSDSISVAVRVRPAQSHSDVNEWMLQDQVIYAAQSEHQHNVFAFDHIFAQDKTNADVYEQVVQPIISSVMAGYHGTVFAYGQTSSGKTHTMMGNEQDAGVIKRAVTHIFNEIRKANDREFLIRISYLEIYNEQIRDLLNGSSSANLQIKGPDMAVVGLTERVTTEADQLLKFMTEGDKNRQLNLVDLAGSERATQTGATGTRLREGCHINTSLTALGIVIRKLSTGEKHINFRDSKLTRILQNSLGGNSRTAIICNISPSDYETSLSTLRFGSDAKRIKNKPVINQVISEDASLLHKRNKEIESLKALMSKVEAGKEQQLKEKDETIIKLRKKIDGLQKLAIGGDLLPLTVTERNVSVLQTRRQDNRRRETWCPGQIAAATPAKSTVVCENPDSIEDSFLAKYGSYKDDFEFCTPARPRKRKSDEAFPEDNKKVLPLADLDTRENFEDSPNLKSELEDARKEIQALREELEFVRNEKFLYCAGACTPSAAKRICFDASGLPTTPIAAGEATALSLIPEEESELEEDSPFGRKLKIMATPRQKIQGMKNENRVLKRTLLASNTCSTSVPYDDTTVSTLCNRTAPSSYSEVKPETCDASCQYESENSILVGLPQKRLVDAATSPLSVPLIDSPAAVGATPLRSKQVLCPKIIPLGNFCSPQPSRKSTLVPAIGSEASWLEAEKTPTLFQANVRDAEVQATFADENRRSDTVRPVAPELRSTSVMTESVAVLEVSNPAMTSAASAKDAETQFEDFTPTSTLDGSSSVTQGDADGHTTQVEKMLSAIIDSVGELVQTDVEPEEIPVDAKVDAKTQVHLKTSCQEVQCSVETADANTPALWDLLSREASTQTADSKGSPAPPAFDRFSFATRCMESPVSVTAIEGVRGLDAILADPPLPSKQSTAKKVKTREVGVLARLEELWVIKMALEQEKTAREDAELKLDEVWKERAKLVNTNDEYLKFFESQGIDPKLVLNRENPQSLKLKLQSESDQDEDPENLKRKYKTLKEFCCKYPDIKDRLVADKVMIRQVSLRGGQSTLLSDVGEVQYQAENIEAPESRTAVEPAVQTGVTERPLAELQDMQKFRGVKYLAEADPGQCKPS